MTRVSLLVSLTLLTALPTFAQDPVFNAKPMSAWMEMLKDDGLPRKRKAAAIALGQIVLEHPDAVSSALPALARSLKNDSHLSVRLQIAQILSQQPAERSEYFFLDAIEALRIEKDSEVRRELATLLGRLDRQALPAIGPLTDILTDPSPLTRARACEALGRIGADANKSAPAILKLAKDPSPAVQEAAIFALGRIDPDNRDAVVAAIRSVLDRERSRGSHILADTAVASTATWTSLRSRSLILVSLAALGSLNEKTTEVAEVLLPSLQDPEAEIRLRCVQALSKLGSGSKPAMKALQDRFRLDSDRMVRAAALRTLNSMKHADLSSWLAVMGDQLGKDPDYEMRVAIAEELGSLGSSAKEVLPALRAAQRDPQRKVREAARQAILLIEKPPEKAKE